MTTRGDRPDGVQVVEVRGNTYHLDVPQLEKILKDDKVKDLPVVVVSVAGAYRGGKSFILNFFLRYLKASLQCRADGSWIGNDITPLEGFSWRGGSKRNTTGIVMWSEPIITKINSGEEVAVILMDTQGTFDSESTVRDCSTIFALSTLLSSIQIYNISTQIREDDLQHLQLFTEYGSLILDNSNDVAFQALEFLVRDWPNACDYPLGSAGGKRYLEEKLQIKPGQAKELSDLRKHIGSSFKSVSCFLMPHPGLVVTEPGFKGMNQDMELKFKRHIKELASYLFGPEMLRPKMINGQRVKTSELFTYFKTYMTIFNSNTIPSPTSIYQATAEAGRMTAYEEARDLYEKSMNNDCGPAKPNLPAHDLKDLHEKHLASALRYFNNKKKMGPNEDAIKYREKLDEELKTRLAQFLEINYGKIQKVMMTAREAYQAKIGQFTTTQALCVHPLDLKQVHNEGLQAAVSLFDKNRRYISKKEDEERAEFIKNFEKQYDHLNLLNEQNNKMAVNDMRLEYWTTMESMCSGENPLANFWLGDAHRTALKAAMKGFDDKRSHPNPHNEDKHKSNLIAMIDNRYEQLRLINRSKNKVALKASIKVYVDYMASAWDSKSVCLHPGDLEDENYEGRRRALANFRPNLVKVRMEKVIFSIDDEDEKALYEALCERFQEIKDLNTASNKTAVEAALNVYKRDMEAYCGFSPSWITSLGAAYFLSKIGADQSHQNSRNNAIKTFNNRRRRSENLAKDCFYDDLESKIASERLRY